MRAPVDEHYVIEPAAAPARELPVGWSTASAMPRA